MDCSLFDFGPERWQRELCLLPNYSDSLFPKEGRKEGCRFEICDSLSSCRERSSTIHQSQTPQQTVVAEYLFTL